MGETSADTQREIESLRNDISAGVEELERRAKSLTDLKTQAEEHPAVLGALGFGLLSGVAVLGYNAVANYRESRKPVNRFKRRADELREEVGGRLSRTREKMPYGVYVMRNRGDEPADAAQTDPGMLKNLLWLGLTAGMVALFGLLARQAAVFVWQTVMREPPPTSKV